MFKSISVAKVRTSFWSPLLPVNSKMNTSVTKLSQMAYIGDAPVNPVKFFLDLLKIYNMSFISMNLATVDRDFGALNRVVVYRGLTNNHVTFVTEKNSRKYLNLMDDPRTSVTFYPIKGVESSWQIRLFGRAVELSPDQISKLWSEEPVFAKIRSQICECGKPIDFLQLRETHDALLKKYEKGEDMLPQTVTYTAFKIVPTIWDFYKSAPNCIADRVQYRKSNPEDEKWDKMHVAA